MKTNYRSGDINLHNVEKTKGKIIEHNGSFVLGLGETTGHKHILTVEKPQDLIIKQDNNGNYYFELLAEGKLTHEEHKTLIVKPGIYKKFQEEEVDNFANFVTRKVID